MTKWCEYQSHTIENPDGWDCLAHMGEGRVFECPYKQEDIREVSPGRLAPAKDPEKYKGVCEDYKPMDES